MYCAPAQFKPASGMNPELRAKYSANKLRVVRQVRYSEQRNCLDLVLFLNGIPIAIAELKSDWAVLLGNLRLSEGHEGRPDPSLF